MTNRYSFNVSIGDVNHNFNIQPDISILQACKTIKEKIDIEYLQPVFYCDRTIRNSITPGIYRLPRPNRLAHPSELFVNPTENIKWFSIYDNRLLSNIRTNGRINILMVNTKELDMTYLPEHDKKLYVDTVVLNNDIILKDPFIRLIDTSCLLLPQTIDIPEIFQKSLLLFQRLKLMIDLDKWLDIAPNLYCETLLISQNVYSSTQILQYIVHNILQNDDIICLNIMAKDYIKQIIYQIENRTKIHKNCCNQLLKYNQKLDHDKKIKLDRISGFDNDMFYDDDDLDLIMEFIDTFASDSFDYVSFLYSIECSNLRNSFIKRFSDNLNDDEVLCLLMMDDKTDLLSNLNKYLKFEINNFSTPEKRREIDKVGCYMNDILYNQYNPYITDDVVDDYIRQSSSKTALNNIILRFPESLDAMKNIYIKSPNDALFDVIFSVSPSFFDGDTENITLARFPRLTNHRLKIFFGKYIVSKDNICDLLANTNIGVHHISSMKYMIKNNILTKEDLIQHINLN